MNKFLKQLFKNVRSKSPAAFQFIRHTPKPAYYIAGFIAVLCIGIVYWAYFFWPITVQFSYAKENCFFQPTFLPQLVKADANETYIATQKPSLSIAGHTLFSTTTCIQPISAPKQHTTQTLTLAPLGNAYFKKRIIVKTPQAPVVVSAVVEKPISTKDTLTFTLTNTDIVFDYKLAVGDKQTNCNKNQAELHCNIAELGLSQSTKYDISLRRVFNNIPIETALTLPITTVEMLEVVASTIKDGEKIFGKPTEMIITLNKAIRSVGSIRLQQHGGEVIPTKQRVEGNKIILTFEKELPRRADIELALESAEAEDKAFLPLPYTMRFATSGGPQVVDITIGRTKVAPVGTLTLSFDSTLAANQALANFIKVDAPGASASFILRGTSIIVNYRGIPRCSSFTIKVLDGLQNDAGVSGGSNWQFNARTICQEVFSIGTSVQGRSILAYRFGNGPKKIIFVGTLHGNEKSASASLASLIADLEINAQNIPAHTSIVVIPIVNPDGYAANSRTNANNIDLNRNFPANNWKSGVTMPGGEYLEQGGGSTPLSEPESRALANFVASQGARLVLSYHSIGPLLAANEAGDSLALAQQYGRAVGWPVYGNDGANNFDYDTTGAFEDWLRDKHSVPGILIELASRSGNEYSSQKNAMWNIVRLP